MAASEVNVWFRGKWYGPSYPDAGDLPAEPTSPPAPAAKPTAESATDTGDEPNPPPKAGQGSSRAKWAEYATANGVDISDDDTRDDIIDACDKAGVPT